MGEQTAKSRKDQEQVENVKVNPLRNETIYVRFVPKDVGLEKKHVNWGGKSDGAFVSLCVPLLRSTGNYKNILTNDEKDFLEEALGLDFNALSVYKKENNYWDNYRVLIPIAKEGLRLNLSNPEDYIKYKVLLANTDIVAPSVTERIERPKSTYQFEIVRESEETDIENIRLDANMRCYKELGKIEGDIDTMRVLIELLDARPYGPSTKLPFYRSRANALIQSDPKAFLRQITDPLLKIKVIIRRGVEIGKIEKRGDFYYLRSDHSPLCEAGEEPTLSVAAKYLNAPSHQDIKFVLEGGVNENKRK